MTRFKNEDKEICLGCYFEGITKLLTLDFIKH